LVGPLAIAALRVVAPAAKHSGGRSSLLVYENGKSVPVPAKLRVNC
jgi:hypothetical protein